MPSKKLTQARRDMLNTAYNLLKKGTTKEVIAFELDISDRAARDLISTIAQKFPIVSLSDRKGYLLLPAKKDLTAEQREEYKMLCNHAINENSKRSAEILKRNEPLQAWANS